MRVTLDTNTLVSGTFWKGKPSEILSAIDSGKIELVISKEIIEEYGEVIKRDEIMEKVEEKQLILNDAVQRIISDAILIEPHISVDIIKEDLDDNRILECAFEGNAEFIITKDNHLLNLREFRRIKIITPEEFMKIFESAN